LKVIADKPPLRPGAVQPEDRCPELGFAKESPPPKPTLATTGPPGKNLENKATSIEARSAPGELGKVRVGGEGMGDGRSNEKSLTSCGGHPRGCSFVILPRPGWPRHASRVVVAGRLLLLVQDRPGNFLLGPSSRGFRRPLGLIPHRGRAAPSPRPLPQNKDPRQTLQ
jgi:hypothetical protein